MIGPATIIRTLGAVAAMTAMLTSSQAEPLAELHAIFPRDEPVCYAQTYDAAHMSAQPDQTVTALRLVHGYPQLRMENEAAGPADDKGNSEASSSDDRGVMAQLVVTFRDAKQNGVKRFAAPVNCATASHLSKLRCGIDCDGGGFLLEREAAGTIRVTIEEGRTLRIAGGCTNHRTYRGLGAGKGDRVFTLAPTPMAACR